MWVIIQEFKIIALKLYNNLSIKIKELKRKLFESSVKNLSIENILYDTNDIYRIVVLG